VTAPTVLPRGIDEPLRKDALMAMKGLLALVCAGIVVGSTPRACATQNDDGDKIVTARLAVQTALLKGKEHLLRGEFGPAVDVLESQLPHIDGDRVYLNLLKDAYRGYIKELRLSKHDNEAKRYLSRLSILDRGAVLDSALAGAPAKESPVGGSPASVLRSLLTPPKLVTAPAVKPTPTVRLKSDEEPPQPVRVPDSSEKQLKSVLAKAEQEFADRHYRAARQLYEDAYKLDRSVAQTCAERWAYCKLYYVVEELKRPTPEPGTDLDQELRLALTLAPRLADAKEVKDLVAALEKRRAGTTATNVAQQNDAGIRHLGRNAEGWNVSESANFRIFHQSQDVAEQTVRVAERTRVSMEQKWFGGGSDPWTPKCDIYLHPTADAYARATGQYNSPGHSSLRLENCRLVVRRIDLHCDEASMLTAVLPHETTHVVLAGQFGGQLLPRWADEGMAVLTEPPEKIERHLANLTRCRQEGQTLFPLQDLMQLDNYPQNPHYISAFYAQSVSLVDYLTNLRGPQTFTMFMHEGMRYGYEKALQRTYNIRNFSELQQRWSAQAFRDRTGATGLANR
jgi:hypothetical protein